MGEENYPNKTEGRVSVMKLRLIKYKSLHSFTIFKRTFSRASLDNELKSKIFRKNPWKLSMKAKSALAIALVAIMLVSVFAWLSAGTQSNPNIVQPVSNDPTVAPSPTSQQTTNSDQKSNMVPEISLWNPISIIRQIVDPTPRPPGLIESNPNVNGPVWETVAANAWQYFQPDTGVVRKTGLPKASLGFPYFTDWDLGVYIQAIIDANKTGLIGNDGDWGSNARIEKVLTFLETRELNVTTGYPFWFYESATGNNSKAQSDWSSTNVDGVDTGRLFVALYNLKTFNPSWASRIDNFVYNRFNNRSDYKALVPNVKTESLTATSIYSYYVASGFASFWPIELSGAPDRIMNNMYNATVTYEGVSLPKATISCEPLLCSVFELNNNPVIKNYTYYS